MRNDAVSMITAIPKELRTGFINRANKVKTLKGLQKLTDEVEAGTEKFERKLAVGELRDTIKKLESKNRLGKVRLGKIPSPQREKLIEIIDEISIKRISTELEPPPEEVKTFEQLDVKARRGREQLLGADLKSLQQVTQRLSSELAGGLEALDANTEAALRLPNERIRQLNLLTQKNVNEIDVDDIKLVTQSLQQLANNAKLGSLLQCTFCYFYNIAFSDLYALASCCASRSDFLLCNCFYCTVKRFQSRLGQKLAFKLGIIS